MKKSVVVLLLVFIAEAESTRRRLYEILQGSQLRGPICPGTLVHRRINIHQPQDLGTSQPNGFRFRIPVYQIHNLTITSHHEPSTILAKDSVGHRIGYPVRIESSQHAPSIASPRWFHVQAIEVESGKMPDYIELSVCVPTTTIASPALKCKY